LGYMLLVLLRTQPRTGLNIGSPYGVPRAARNAGYMKGHATKIPEAVGLLGGFE